jgi:hypothetical protein
MQHISECILTAVHSRNDRDVYFFAYINLLSLSHDNSHYKLINKCSLIFVTHTIEIFQITAVIF